MSFKPNNSFRLAMIVIITVIAPVIVICLLLRIDWIEEEGRMFAHLTFVHKWDWISVLFALSSYVIAILTFLSQRQTERNTTKSMTKEIQLSLLKGCLNRLYINYIMATAILVKCSETGFKSYPSEEHKYKMLMPEDMVHPELFYDNTDNFEYVHSVLQKIRVYNEEIQIVWEHLKTIKISSVKKENDIDNILRQKPGTLAWDIALCINRIWRNNPDELANVILAQHSLKENKRSGVDIPKEDIMKSKFINFFPKEFDRNKFISKVRQDVFIIIDNPNSLILFPLLENE